MCTITQLYTQSCQNLDLILFPLPHMLKMMKDAAYAHGSQFKQSGFGAGALFLLLGILAVALQADYPFMCAFSNLSGDYSKAAHALSRITAWNSGTLMKFWALSWLTVPLLVFAVVFWLCGQFGRGGCAVRTSHACCATCTG